MSVRAAGLRGMRACIVAIAIGVAVAASGQSKEADAPKVPFGGQPCQSLSSADQENLKTGRLETRAYRSYGGLTSDNACEYTRGGTQKVRIEYSTKRVYDSESEDNRSREKKAPADLPGAFYDAQGNLWFAKNGYYIAVAGRSELREAVAKLIASRL